MAWGFLDWVRGRPVRPDPEKLALPDRPTEQDLRRVLMLLLDDEKSYEASCLLEDHQDRARPMLEALLVSDPRFREMHQTSEYTSQPRFERVLDLLFRWGSTRAVDEALVLAHCSNPALRAIAGRLLARTGAARFAEVLLHLTRDDDDSVRRSVGYGISGLIGYSETCGSTPEPALVTALFDYMRECALRTDRGPSHGFADVLFRFDRPRAVEAFSCSVLTPAHRLSDLVPTLRRHGVTIPRERIDSLIEGVMAVLDAPSFDSEEHPGIESDLNELILALAEHDQVAALELIHRLRSKPQGIARKAAMRAREQLTPDPVKAALAKLDKLDAPSRLCHEHQVVYRVWLLDAEVGNGGWLQWVANSSGAYAELTLAALREIGADAAAKELEQVMAALGPEGRHPQQKRRMAAIDRMMSAGRSLPDDGTMWELSIDLKWLLFDYGNRHPAIFDTAD